MRAITLTACLALTSAALHLAPAPAHAAPAPLERPGRPRDAHPAALCGDWRLRWHSWVEYSLALRADGTYACGDRIGAPPAFVGTWEARGGRLHLREALADGGAWPGPAAEWREYSLDPSEPGVQAIPEGGAYAGTRVMLRR